MNNTITIEGKTYALESLSDTTRKLVGIHSKWSQELDESRMEVAKLEAALRDLSREVVEAVNTEQPAEYVEPTTKPAKKAKKAAATA